MQAKLLKNYLEDLKNIHSSSGIESVNFYSSGTPYFESEQEFYDYLNEVEKAIRESNNER